MANLPRHARDVHQISDNKSKSISQIFGLRKTYTYHNGPPIKRKKTVDKSEKNTKPYVNNKKMRCCPIYGCFSSNKRMPLHLQEVHGMKAGAPKYYQALKDAKPFQEWSEKFIEKACNNESQDEEDSATNESEDLCKLEVFQRFLNWSVSVEGGRGTRKQAKQSVQELTYMMKAAKSENIEVLFDKIKMRDDFLRDFAEGTKAYKPLTIQRFLKALTDFYSFVIDEEINILGLTSEEVLRMKLRVSQWKKSYNEPAKAEEWKRMREEQSVLITPEQVKAYETSEGATNAIRLLSLVSSPYKESELTRQEYTCVRDYLLTEIEISNCHRSGVTSNMLLEEVTSALLKDGKYIIQVANHKTKNTHGPAMVCVGTSLFNDIVTFVEKIRSAITTELKNVFVSFYGKQLASGAISKQINSLWQRSGVYGDNEPPKKNISANIFRKSGSTAIEEHNPSASKYVSSLLAHSESTSKKYYRLNEKQAYAIKGSEHLQQIFRNTEGNQDVEDNSKKRFIWSPEQTDELQELFSESIENKTVSIETIRSVRPKFKHLTPLSNNKIRDKVRGLWRFSTTEASSTLPEEVETIAQKLVRLSPVKNAMEASDGEYQPSTVEGSEEEDADDDWVSVKSSATSKKVFTSTDVVILKRCCCDIIISGPQSIGRITDALKKSDDGKRVLKMYKMTQIQTRLKYERRQYTLKQ